MKTLCLILFGAFIGAWAEDLSFLLPDPSWAKPVLQTNRKLKVQDDTCSAVYSCKDCSTARVCKPTGDNGIFVKVQEIECPKERPFCNSESGTCVVDAPGQCGKEDEFICMGNGRYPDTDCKKFHVCINYKATSFECKVDGHSYNPKTQTCDMSSTCGTFDCSSNEVRKTPHDVHPKYFAFCNEDSKGALVVDSCPDQFKLDTETQLCAPDCTTDGIIADPADCHKYYKCTTVNIKKDLKYLSVEKHSCPEGQAYSKTEFLCIDETKVDTCQNKK